jgi:hypothetical protein
MSPIKENGGSKLKRVESSFSFQQKPEFTENLEVEKLNIDLNDSAISFVENFKIQDTLNDSVD